MKRRVYIETTIVSYFTARPSRDLVVAGHQEVTRELWPKFFSEFEPYISALVYQEVGQGDVEQVGKRLEAIKPFKMLDTDEEALHLADKIITDKGIPEAFPEDALHIAIAAVNGMELLITWNFAHIHNPFTRMMVRQLVEDAGYQAPEICSPDELMETDQ